MKSYYKTQTIYEGGNILKPTQKNFKKQLIAFAMSCVLLFSSSAIPSRADVTDNAETALLEQTVGSWSDTDQSHSVIGLLRLIITKLSRFDSRFDSLDAKIEAKTAALQTSIENIGQSVNASYNLYVYIPKSCALADYSGQQIRITSTSGNQNASATLRDDGNNYSTTLYFNFSGSCRLNYNLLSSTQTCAVELPVTINATGQEQNLVKSDGYRYTLDYVHVICSDNRAADYLSAGDVLACGWTVVNVNSNAVQLWRKTNLGDVTWSSANSTAQSYYNTFNAENRTNVSFKSGLLSKSEVESGWLAGNRVTGAYYWLETLHSSGYHWCVNDDGGVGGYGDSASYGCFPAVWIH